MQPHEDDLHAPGRKVMRRKNGRADAYWVASREAVAAGYAPKTVKLLDDPGADRAPPEVAARCRRYWAEMLEFVAGNARTVAMPPVGTLEWLCTLYQTDLESPYRDVRPITRQGYDKALKIISETVGKRRIADVSAKDVKRWHRAWGRADENGQLANPRRAYGCIQVLRIIVKYGKGLRNKDCRELSEILSEAEFSPPRPRKVALSEVQFRAFMGKAIEAGELGLARAVSLQFCCGLRQKDVIGEWVAGRWSIGLLWGEHVKADWRLEKPTSKSNFNEVAEFDLRLIPVVMQELQRTPQTGRIGPVVLDDRTGRPFRQREFAARFRVIARAAEIPDTIWNMDARAGAITDAYNKGAQPSDVMDMATHKQLSTNLGYKRGRTASTSRVTKLRFGGENDG